MKTLISVLIVLMLGATQVFAFGFASAEGDRWFGADKFGHLAVHAMFTSYLYGVDRPLFPAEKSNNAKVAKIAFCQSFSTGFVYEVNDGFTGVGDGFSPKDMCYNIAGATLGTYLTYRIKPNGFSKVSPVYQKWANKPYARVGSAALATFAYSAFDRFLYSEQDLSRNICFWRSTAAIGLPSVTVDINHQLFYPKGARPSWKNMLYDAGGSLLGAWIARQTIRHNPDSKLRLTLVKFLRW